MASSDPDRVRSSSLRILLVAHTHWDREWYHPAARFRQRLIPLVDALLDSPEHGGLPFLLDGQAIVLDDYTSVRPERADDLAAALSQGALEAGPWFVLADNLIPSGEAILRNLEAGRRVLDRYRATAPAVAYCPDSFGHPAAMPLIAAGYGFPLAVVWRGLGARAGNRDALWWRGPDDSRVLLHHLPPDGYETGASLPRDPVPGSLFWTGAGALLGDRNDTGVTLLPGGADHHAAQSGLARALQIGADLLGAGASLERVSLSTAAAALMHAARRAEASGRALREISGELRDSYGYTWTLQGTFGTRAHQKRANARLERALLADVEPWLVLASLHGTAVAPHDGRIGAMQAPALLAHAWEALLATHPHDTLCGCSIDDVARAMSVAQASVRSQVAGLRAAALETALQHDAVAARARTPGDRLVVVRNRAAYPRGGVAELRGLETIGDVPVGPGSATATVPSARAPANGPLRTLGAHQVQAGRGGVRHARRESPQHYPDNDVVLEHRVLAWVPPVPAHGLLVIDREDGRPYPPESFDANGEGAEAPRAATPPFVPVTTDIRDSNVVVISNGIIELRAGPAGVRVQRAHRVLASALSIETVRDHGDSYTPSLRGAPAALVLRSVRLLARGPLRASVALDWEHDDPSREAAPADLDRHRDVSAAPRVIERRGRVHVRTTLVLDAASEIVRCDVVTRNRMHDHRLQLVWHTDITADATVRADVAFGYVERNGGAGAAGSKASDNAGVSGTLVESEPTTMPIHRWVCACDSHAGVTMLSDGLAEGEAIGGRLALTLVRAVGELSRGDLPERPGHAGWPAAIPAAQCQGTYRARLGLLLHGPWSDGTLQQIEESADALLLPLVGETWRDLETPVRQVSGPTLVGDGLRASAVTMSRDARAMILRVRNLADESRSGAWVMPVAGPWRITEVRLDETPLGLPRESTDRASFTVAPRALLTLRVERVAG